MTPATYCPLPSCPERRPDEPAWDYQATCLKFLLSTSCTATLSDDQLQGADVAAQRAASQVQTTATKGQIATADCAMARVISATSDQQVLDALSAARHTIAQVLKWRADQSTIAEVVIPNIAQDPKKDGGVGVPRVPVSPFMPAGSLAVDAF